MGVRPWLVQVGFVIGRVYWFCLKLARRYVKDRVLWYVLASMAVHARELNTAEVRS